MTLLGRRGLVKADFGSYEPGLAEELDLGRFCDCLDVSCSRWDSSGLSARLVQGFVVQLGKGIIRPSYRTRKSSHD